MKSIGRQISRGVASGVAVFLAIPMLTACGSSGRRNQQMAGNYYAPVRNQYPYSQNQYPGTAGLNQNASGYPGSMGGTFTAPQRYGQPGFDPMSAQQRGTGFGMNGQTGFGMNRGGFGQMGRGGMTDCSPQTGVPCVGATQVPCAPGQVCPPVAQQQPPVGPAPAGMTPSATTQPMVSPAPESTLAGIRVVPRWKELCDKMIKDGQKTAAEIYNGDSDSDGITDGCEDELVSIFPALDKNAFNGYAVSAIKLDSGQLMGYAAEAKLPDSKCSSDLKDPKKLNQCLAEAVIGLSNGVNSDLEIVNKMYDGGVSANNTTYIDGSKSRLVEGAKNIALIKGGYASPPLINQTKFRVGAEFSPVQLNGLGKTIDGLEGLTPIQYLVESCIHLPADVASNAIIKLVPLVQGDRPAGVFQVYENGNLEVSTVDVSRTKGHIKKRQRGMADNESGELEAGMWEHFALSVAIPYEKKGVSQEILNFNFLVSFDDGKTYEFMPQEISRARCDDVDAQGQETLEKTRILQPFTIKRLGSSRT